MVVHAWQAWVSHTGSRRKAGHHLQQAMAFRRHRLLHRAFVGAVVFRLTRRLTRRVVAACAAARAPRVQRQVLVSWRQVAKGRRRRAALSAAAGRWHAANRTSHAFAAWRQVAPALAAGRSALLAQILEVCASLQLAGGGFGAALLLLGGRVCASVGGRV